MPSNLSVSALYERARETGRPLVGGHRGNPADCPENTLASFRSAIELGVDMIECDVHLSADGELVVIHDDTLERTTDGGGPVARCTLAELRELDAGAGERLPVLAEVCELARGRAGLCIEVKHAGPERKLVSQLRELNFIEQAAVISFEHAVVREVKASEPALIVGVLEGARSSQPGAVMSAAGAQIYAPHYGAMDDRLGQEVAEAGGVMGVWTVDDMAALAWCRRCKPLSIFTNRPRVIGPAIGSIALS